jgi:hypothetical protein
MAARQLEGPAWDLILGGLLLLNLDNGPPRTFNLLGRRESNPRPQTIIESIHMCS